MDALLATHRRLLEARRHAMNLVGPGDLEPHYLDARRGLAGLHPVGLWADLGSGAGFPGIVFAAMFPEVAVHLIERRQKRAVFLEAVLIEARDLVAARPAPIEVQRVDLTALSPGTYDGVLARALAPAAEVLTIAWPLLKPGGQAVLFIQGDAREPHVDGYARVAVHPYRVEGRAHKTVSWRKI